jgi:uncharacterized repeat protein (TIGR04076 family)
MKRELKIVVKEIKGKCPAFKEGDEFFIYDGYLLKTDFPLCLHALSSLMPYYVALSRGIKPEELNLGKDGRAYVQCLDPCEYTGGGTVIFEIHVKETEEA